MKQKKTLRILLIIAIAGFLIGGSIGLYMYFMPERNVQKLPADYKLTASELVAEFFSDMTGANKKYLSADGESKILEITGTVSRISENFNGEKVVLLKNESDRAGVSSTFLSKKISELEGINPGDLITIKGVIRSGAYYDKDLDMHVNVVIEKSDLIR